MAAERPATPRALLIVTLTALAAVLVALVLAFLTLHQPALAPISVPSGSPL